MDRKYACIYALHLYKHVHDYVYIYTYMFHILRHNRNMEYCIVSCFSKVIDATI